MRKHSSWIRKIQTSLQTGYSGAPLLKKLGIKENFQVAILNLPNDSKLCAIFADSAMPHGVTLQTTLLGKHLFDIVLFFAKHQIDLQTKIDSIRSCMVQTAGLWVAWPKKASGIPTDITEQALRDMLLPTGLVDNKVCAIDATWSGLRFVIRRKHREVLSSKKDRSKNI